MRKPVAIVAARDVLPAHRFLVFAIITAAVAAALPGLACAESVGKAGRSARHDSRTPPVAVRGIATPDGATSANLRAANDSMAATGKAVDGPTGSVRSSGVMAKPASKTVGVAPSGGAIPVPAVTPTTQKASSREWYPESHSYLRPYHYKWRYWTPG
jgi:hypothetical protein